MSSDTASVIGVDTGGTFTDVFSSGGAVHKVASTPDDPVRSIVAGLRVAGISRGDAVAHGTTVATNAILERKGARTALITTAGFEDVLEIRRQNRPALYDLNARWPDPLVPRELRVGVRERLDYTGHVLTALDARDVERAVAGVLAAGGPPRVEAIAVCLLFSYANPAHEQTVAEAVQRVAGDGVGVSVSHLIAPRYGEFERTSTTVVNAYVMPVMANYLESLGGAVEQLGIRNLHIMQSNGGLASVEAVVRRPVHTVLSGPAAGVVGAHALAARAGRERVITFDMGGTSTDVAVVVDEVAESGEGEISSFPLLIPMLTIETVGAGGGSIARLDAGGGLRVGPDSAGADPGPAAYGKGSVPTVTDANLVLGRLSPRGLLGGAMALDVERARAALRRIAGPLNLTVEQAAWAVVRLANSNMDRAVRTVTLQRGHDPRRFTLFPFGGAGPLHAAELATDLGIGELLVPPHPGVMAALGLTIPDLRRNFQQTVLLGLENGVEERLEATFAALERRARNELGNEELFGELTAHRWVDMRYAGQSFELRLPHAEGRAELEAAFTRAYDRRYGYSAAGRPVQVVNVMLRATLPRTRVPQIVPSWPGHPRPEEKRQVWFGTSAGLQDIRPHEAAILWRPSLDRGTRVPGPAVVEQYDSATVLPPGWEVTVDDAFNLVVRRR
jgi:N-methylhydantoinase A